MTKTLILVSFIAGFAPAMLLFVLYGFRTTWERTLTGWVLMMLISITAISYALSTAVLIWPGWFHDTTGTWWRIVIRFLVAAVLWGLLVVFLRAQRGGAVYTKRGKRND